jgi:hypothetical protein
MSDRRISRFWKYLKRRLNIEGAEERRQRERRQWRKDMGLPDETLVCGHDASAWYSICSRHHDYREACGLCNVGRCIKCHPKSAEIGERMKFFNRRDGSSADPFPNLGVRTK